jgi:hypothetical protein
MVAGEYAPSMRAMVSCSNLRGSEAEESDKCIKNPHAIEIKDKKRGKEKRRKKRKIRNKKHDSMPT